MLGRATIIWGLVLAAAGSAAGQPPPAPIPGLPPNAPAVATPAARDRFQEPPLNPVSPPRDPESELVLPDGQRVTLPQTVRQQIRFAPRYGTGIDSQRVQLDKDGREDKTGKGEGGQRWVITGGVIVSVVYLTDRPGEPPQEVEFATDCAVAWISSKSADPLGGAVETDGKTKVELYLCGNVVIRRFTRGEGLTPKSLDQVLRAKEVYYDVSRNRAVAMNADIELRVQGVTDPLHLTAAEVFQYGPNEIEGVAAETSSSKRPSDPALRVAADSSVLVRGTGPRTNFLGIPYRDLLTGRPLDSTEQTLSSRNVKIKVFDFPVFWLPRTSNDIAEPFGPLAGFGLGNDQVFGVQVYTTFDMFKLLALRGPPGHKWNVYADYLSFRGPGVGTTYDYNGTDLLGLAGPRNPLTNQADRPDWDQPFRGFARAYAVNDKGLDNLGPDRGTPPPKPTTRGRLQWQHNGDVYESGTTYLRLTAQAEYLSDANFLEQYYKQEFDMRPNQETFLSLAAADGNRWASLLAQKNVSRPWVTETNSLPRADAAVVGQDLGPFSYTAKGSLGYYQLRPADPLVTPPSFLLTEQQDVNTFRGDVNQRIGLPVDVGPFRVEPYGTADLTYYSQTLTGDGTGTADGRGRFYGGGGARLSTSLSRLFPDAQSELFNVTGINHKVTWGANYFAGYSDTAYTRLPLLDRLNDDATDQGYRTARQAYAVGRPTETIVTRPDGSQFRVIAPLVSRTADDALARSAIFDPQRLAIRRLTPDRVDTLDSLQVVQLDVRNRWQTKRGFPGQEHVVDWLSLDLAMSVFPDKDRDNFGKSTGQYMYNSLWNVGDRTSLFSSGWYDPFDTGARYVQVGASYNRPDNSVFYGAYRFTDPIDSRILTAGLSYPLSRKYTVNGGASYDFGATTNQVTTLSFARVGTDVTLLFGFSYNAIVKNVGFQFAVVPNLAGIGAQRLAGGGLNTQGGGQGAGR